MRISDWSSDVCSSDLRAHDPALREHITQRCLPARLAIADGDLPVQRAAVGVFICDQRTQARSIGKWHAIRLTNGDEAVAAEADDAGIDRKGVGAGKSVSVRVNPGGRRIIKKKN